MHVQRESRRDCRTNGLAETRGQTVRLLLGDLFLAVTDDSWIDRESDNGSVYSEGICSLCVPSDLSAGFRGIFT